MRHNLLLAFCCPLCLLMGFSFGYLARSLSIDEHNHIDKMNATELCRVPTLPSMRSCSYDHFSSPLSRLEKPASYLPGHRTDIYTPFHDYMRRFGEDSPNATSTFDELPLLHIWPTYFEAYHNHWHRYRGKNVTFMEIGVQSGGKIPLLREYFGDGLTYVGIDINPSTEMFESEPWIHIEIGDAGDNVFLESLKRKYRKVDLFLDDGGHTMQQQIITMKEMLPHIKPDGVYMCEDLSTSWSEKFGGMSYKTHDDESFRETTMFGLVHRSLDWLNAGWIPGGVMKYKADDERLKSVFWRKDPWWKEFSSTVKRIHCYNQLIVYEKGLVETPFATKTKGKAIPLGPSGKHPKVDWKIVMDILRSKQ